MTPRICAAVALVACAGWAAAQPANDKASAAPATTPASTTSSTTTAQEKPTPGEPAVQRTVVEDEGVRIEETRVRGQVTRVVVRSKQADVKAYELLVGSAARDPSQRGQTSGQRVWHILSF